MEQQESAAHPISESEDIGPYRLASPVEVGFILRSLANRADFITVYFNNGRDLLLTRVLHVDQKKREFIFDLSGHQPSNDALQKTEKAIFVALPDGVKVQFATGHVRLVDFEEKPAFIAPFPPDVIKLQRREFFRLNTPISNPYYCRLNLPQTGDQIQLEIHDVSLGGLGMWLPKSLNAKVDKIDMGLTIEQAMFDFGAGGVMRADIEVRNCRPIENRQGQTQYIVGVRFINLTRSQEANLQRLITQLERERKALLD